jgi:AraC-like DNA-binding protein
MDTAYCTAFPVIKNRVVGRARIVIDDETAPNRRDIDRVLLLEYALDRVSAPGSGGSIIFDRSGVLVKADTRALCTLGRANVALEPDLQIEGLVGGEAARLPGWLRPEWLQPVFRDSRRIGTVVILPARVEGRTDSGALAGYKLRRVREFIDAHIGGAIRLGDMAAAAAVSPYHFHRVFKKTTGMTPRQYVVHARIERAKCLLTQSDLRLADIAGHSGFTDQSHFTTAFRKITSMTPKEFRNLASA